MQKVLDWFVKGTGLFLGFLFSILILFVFSNGFGSLWMPIAAGIVAGFWFGMLPRLNASGARWYLAAFQANAMAWAFIISSGFLGFGPIGRVQKAATGLWIVATVVPLIACLILFAKNQGRKRPARGWLFTIVIMGVLIGYASSSRGGASPMVAWFSTQFHLTTADAETAVIAFRKTVHFMFYGFLGFAAFRAGWGSGAGRTSAIFAVGYVFTICGFDELRQATTLGRTGSAWDVLLDLIGATIFVTLTARWVDKKDPNPKVSKPISSTMRP